MATQFATISDQKSALERWTPVFLFDVTLKDGVPRRWAKQGVTFAGNAYSAIVLNHSEFRQEGNGIYGVDAVTEIGLILNNADANLNALVVPGVWQGGIIQPRFIFVSPDGATTTDAIVYPKFLLDLPSATWPRIECSAHNRWNLGRKTLPVSLVTRKDRYPFPDTAAERTAAGSDPSSPFFAIGYDPDTGKGNMKPGGGYYRRHEYDGTRENLKQIGLEVRFGGFGKAPPTIVATPSKGETAEYAGNANEAKYGTAVPLIFGICRIQPIVLDTGFPTAWNGSRLSHYLLSDGVNFAPEHINGIEDVLDVFIPDNPKFQRIPETSGEPQTTGAWSFQGGYFGSQKAPASSKYRNIDQATDFPVPAGDHPDRDLYSGLAYLEIGFPKELSGQDGIGPKLEAIVKGLKLEWWDSAGNSDWAWTDNPVWIFVHCLKLLRWTTAEMDKPAIAAAAAYCEELVPSGKKRFRCNLALMNQTAARDVLRGIRNNCRMYTTFAADGKLQLRIARDLAGEGGLAFVLDNTNIMRGDDGQLLVEKFHRSIYEIANVFSATFQNEENLFNSDSYTKVDVGNLNQIDERISSDSIFPILGLPSFDQAERQMEWARQEQVVLNEYYRVTCSLALIEVKVGQVGTITEPRHALIAQQVRIRAMAPGPDAGTVELILQKHSDGAYTDNAVETPFTRAQSDSSYTPRSVGGKTSASPAPTLTEVTVADPTNADTSVRRIKVEFKPPAQAYEGVFSRGTKIRDVVVATSGGSIPGGQVLFVEVSPVKAGARGLASEYLMAVIPSGGNSNTITVTCELPPEADQYILFVGNFPGQTYEQTVATSPGTAPFTITVTNLARNFGSIPPDPAFDHVQIFYTYNSSPNVLRDGGRTTAPDEMVIEFEPEAPAAEDTQVTVIVSSSNAAEDDFYPINISPKAILTLTYENGPAQGWTATLLPGPTPSSVVAKFTRPNINGERLFWVAAQIKDSGTGAWRELDDNAGASVVYYDGSAISHESIGGLRIKKDPGQPVGFGTAHLDDLMMFDVAGGSFNRDRCQWGTVEQFLDDLGAPTTAANARYIALTGGLFRPQTTQDLRMKIVKPPHTWDTEGYIGPSGVWWEWIGDREGDEFILKPFEIGREIASVDVRFWIENDYCRSGGNGTHSTNAVHVRAGRDDVIPGPVQGLVVTGANGEFIAKWNDPLTGAVTIDDVAIQWATDTGFTAIVGTAAGWGDVNRLSGTDPNKTYYWRVAAHNLSDQPSHASTAAALGPTGWGPWTAYGSPTAVSSGSIPGSGAPVDTVLPGFLQNLVIQGRNGEFIADWDLPATGNLTIDDHAIQYALDAAFTSGGNTSQGWGPGTHQQSTAPNQTYYFRIAAHNQSGLASDSGTASLGATGWGPWTLAPGNPVSSGAAANTGAISENLVPNGSFEYDADSDGVPDDCTYPMNGPVVAGAGRQAGGPHGSWNFRIPSTSGSSVALGGFAVYPGERLSVSGRMTPDFVSAVGGFYFRLLFAPVTAPRQFTAAEATAGSIDIVSALAPSATWTKYEGQATVPTGAAWCRVELYNAGDTGVQYYFDDIVVTRTTTTNDIGDNTVPPGKFTGEGRSDFVETFEQGLGNFWLTAGGGFWQRIGPGQGLDGGYALRGQGMIGLYTDTQLIPFDPRKLYRLSVRLRAINWASAAVSVMYVGVRVFDSNKTYIGQVFVGLNNFAGWGWTPGNWNLITGWFKGHGAGAIQPASDAANPSPLPTGTSYICPLIHVNWHASATTIDITDMDDIRIESFDEQIYTSDAPNGTFSSPLMQVVFPYPNTGGDVKTSAVNFYWTYTQGTIKAHQFAISINDGTAYWTELVPAQPGNGPIRMAFWLFGLNNNRSFTVRIAAQGMGFGGEITGASHTFGPFTPSANSGTNEPSATLIGTLDWAGGNVWYDSIQYRNNLLPSNAPGAAITFAYTHSGSGASRCSISNLNTYAQGSPNIATHLAVLIKQPSGTIDLNRDMVVTYISMTSLPAVFEIPLSIPDAMSCSVTVAAVAETRNGRQFNTTTPTPATKDSGRILLQASNVPTDKVVQIGRSGFFSTESAQVHTGLQFHDVDNGAYRGRIYGQGNAQYWVNQDGSYLALAGGGQASLGIGTTSFGGGQHMLVFAAAPAILTPVSGNGYLYQQSGAGHWMSGAGTHTTFAPGGPHCAKCGYDFWRIAMSNQKWKAYLYECGMCGEVYKKGPKKILKLLTKEQQKDIISHKNADLFGRMKGEVDAEDQRPRKARVRRRDIGRKWQPGESRLRRSRSKPLRARR